MKRNVAAIAAARLLFSVTPTERDSRLAEALGLMAECMGGGRCWLFLADGADDLVLCQATEPLDPGAQAGIGPVGDYAKSPATPMILDGRSGDTPDGLRRFLAARGAGRVLVAPIIIEAGFVGAGLMGLLCREAVRRQPDEGELAAQCAGLIGDHLRRNRQIGLPVGAVAQRASAAMTPADPPWDAAGPEVQTAGDLPPGMARMAGEAVRQALTLGGAGTATFDLDLPSGRHNFEVRGPHRHLGEADQEPTAVLIVRDVTQETSLHEELRRLGSVTQAMSNLVVIVDTELKVTWINPAVDFH